MPTLTDREALIILETMQRIQAESRMPVQRKNRITNLASKVSVIIHKSQRRKK